MLSFKVTGKDGKRLLVMTHNVAMIEPVEGSPGEAAKPAVEGSKAIPGEPAVEAKQAVAARPASDGEPAVKAQPAVVGKPGRLPVAEVKAQEATKAVPAKPETAIIHLIEGGNVEVNQTIDQLHAMMNGTYVRS